MQIGDKVRPLHEIAWDVPRIGRSPIRHILRPQYTYTVRFVSKNGKWFLIDDKQIKVAHQPCLLTRQFYISEKRQPNLVLASC